MLLGQGEDFKGDAPLALREMYPEEVDESILRYANDYNTNSNIIMQSGMVFFGL